MSQAYLKNDALIEELNRAGQGDFACPSCGGRAGDTNPFPYCLRCTAEEMVAADREAPPECRDHKNGYPPGPRPGCLRCQVRVEWVRRRARRVLDDDGPHLLPEMVNLADLLAEPDEETPFLVEDLWPVDGHVVLSGAAKSGKTTLRNNLIRALADGDPFLGTFDVPEAAGRVVVLDLELTRNQLRGWLRDQEIAHPSRVDVIPMKGQAHALDLFSPRQTAQWTGRLRGADVVILDCLEPVLLALRLDPNTEARKFLEEWGAMLTEAGVAGSAVLHHHGHSGERAKGDSGILGWPDALWTLTNQVPNDTSTPRYFSAFGRDVEVAESRLTLDGSHLRYVAGSPRAGDRARSQAQDAEQRLLAALRADHEQRVADGEERPRDGLSVRWTSSGAVEQIGRGAGLSRDAARQAKEHLVGRNLLVSSTRGSSHSQQFAISAKGMEE